MKKMLSKIFSLTCVSAFMMTATHAANPASTQWVMQQIAANQKVLTASDWNAVCTTGSPTSPSGCYGNVSSAAFVKVSDRLGGFTSYANINPANVNNSVFIKSFFGGTNIPVNNGYPGFLQIQLINSAARCGLFTQEGYGTGVPGVSTTIPANGTSGGMAPSSASVVSINNATSDAVYTNNQNDTASVVAGSPNSDPLYLVCAGYSPTNGSSAAPISVNAT